MRELCLRGLRFLVRRLERASGGGAAPKAERRLSFVDRERGYDLGELGPLLLARGVIQDPDTRDAMQLDVDSGKILVEQFNGSTAEVSLDFFLLVASAYESVRPALFHAGTLQQHVEGEPVSIEPSQPTEERR